MKDRNSQPRHFHPLGYQRRGRLIAFRGKLCNSRKGIQVLKKALAASGRGAVLALLLAGALFAAAQTVSSESRVPTNPSLGEKVVQYLRERFGIPGSVKLALGPFRNTFDPNLFEVTVTLDDGKEKKDQKLLVSKDGRHLILGEVYDLTVDLREVALRTISTKDQPAQGPESAPVTIVEYADLQCPTCARLHEFLENELLPKYGDKVRVIFKEFPLTGIHDWAEKAAIASECGYQLSPEGFVSYRTLIFKNQVSINASNARDMLLSLAAQAGIDSLKLAACLDSQASRPRVEEGLREGKQLGVTSTPTSYVNGRLVLSLPDAQDFYSVVDEALRAQK
jgi:protein-disulfide isomerase